MEYRDGCVFKSERVDAGDGVWVSSDEEPPDGCFFVPKSTEYARENQTTRFVR